MDLVFAVLLSFAGALGAALIVVVCDYKVKRKREIRSLAATWGAVLVEASELMNRIHSTATKFHAEGSVLKNEIHITPGLRQDFYARSEAPQQTASILFLFDFIMHCESNLRHAQSFVRSASQFKEDDPQILPFNRAIAEWMGGFMWMVQHRHEENRRRLIDAHNAYNKFCEDNGIDKRFAFVEILVLTEQMQLTE